MSNLNFDAIFFPAALAAYRAAQLGLECQIVSNGRIASCLVHGSHHDEILLMAEAVGRAFQTSTPVEQHWYSESRRGDFLSLTLASEQEWLEKSEDWALACLPSMRQVMKTLVKAQLFKSGNAFATPVLSPEDLLPKAGNWLKAKAVAKNILR